MAERVVDPAVPPSGDGCLECEESGGWWYELRRCALCGHVGCCDTSPSQHATAHARTSGHPVITTFEPGDRWFYDYRDGSVGGGPALAPPLHHPLAQTTPGPADRVPPDWREHLH
jgi:hypothetical protein